MANIFDYVTNYGNKTFEEMEFTEVDNIIFSLLSYLDLSDTEIFNKKESYPLGQIGKEFLKINTYKEVSKLGIPQRDAYKLMQKIVDTKRYRDLLLSDYRYVTGGDKQFSALTFDISKNLRYICFEGTDELISGWKEDGELACQFPVPSHLEAIKYANEHIDIFGPQIMIGGHSKGGNMALVAGMYVKWYKKGKIKCVYNNDGPGLRYAEFNSREYKSLKKKYIHIVPNNCYIGIMLRNDIYNVIKSNKKNILSHSIITWQVDKDKFVKSELSEKSKKLESSLLMWLDKHNDTERLRIIKALFKVFEDANIEDTIAMLKVGNIVKIVRNIRGIDKQTRDMIVDLFTYNYNNMKKKTD